jgi:glycosyltransferase involved in cell wall biosynthesis
MQDQEQELREWLQGGGAAYCALPVGAGDWFSHFTQAIQAARSLPPLYLPHPGPWALWPREDRFLLQALLDHPRQARLVFCPAPESSVGIRLLWRWFRSGAREAWLLEDDCWKEYDVFGLLVHRSLRRIARIVLHGNCNWLDRHPVRMRVMLCAMRFLRRYRPPCIVHREITTPLTASWEKWIAVDNQREPLIRHQRDTLRIVQYLGALYPGGAERQLCNLAAGLRQRGHQVRVLVKDNLKAERGHYAALLKRQRMPLRQASAAGLTTRMAESLPWQLLAAVPPTVRQAVINLAVELAADPPDVLHCWLDEPNVVGFIAGMIAEVPAIILSTRNSNPTHFPRLCQPFFKTWYQLAALSRRVHFIANSRSGAASYAEWIGIPVARFHLLFNGIDLGPFPEATDQARLLARKSLGCHETDHVVSGVFRLAEEKQPDLFLDVIHRVWQRVPKLRVLLAGSGDLEGHVAQRVAREGLTDCVCLLGRRSDVATVLLASDVNLLTSKLEGTPNIALETQYLGTPIVATAGGGTVDAVSDGVTGFLTGVCDAQALANRVSQVLLDSHLRQRLASAGPAFVTERFGLDAMIDGTIAVYEQALGLTFRSARDQARVA